MGSTFRLMSRTTRIERRAPPAAGGRGGGGGGFVGGPGGGGGGRGAAGSARRAAWRSSWNWRSLTYWPRRYFLFQVMASPAREMALRSRANGWSWLCG